VPLRRLFKSTSNTAFHPHPFPRILGIIKHFERHVKKENVTCAALHSKALPLTSSKPWFQLFLAFEVRLQKNAKKNKKPPTQQNPKLLNLK